MGVSPVFWKSLNGGWPEGMVKPDDKTVVHGVKRLWRHVTRRPCPYDVIVVHHRARRTWVHWRSIEGKPARQVLIVSPDYHHPHPGWPAIVHDLSHYLHWRMNRAARPHDSRQARLEQRLQRYVIENLI